MSGSTETPVRAPTELGGLVRCFCLLSLVSCSSDPASPADDGGAAGAPDVAAGGEQGGSPAMAGASGSAIGGSAGGIAEGGSAGMGGSAVASPPTHRIAATEYGTCALDAEGNIQCWGAAPGVWEVPSGAFVELFGGGDKICGVREDRTFACFSNPVGTPGPIDYAPEGNVRELAMHRLGLCAIDEGGNTLCGVAVPENADLTPPAGQQFEHISVGVYFACGLLAVDGSVVCWGNPTTTPDDGCEPSMGRLDAPAGAFSSLSSGPASTCAVSPQGTLTCWGSGDAADERTEACGNFKQSVPPDGAFRSVSANSNHSCGVKANGEIACWGAGTTDECTLDVSSNCRQSRPPAGTFEQVVTGRNHSCAMTADRKVQCWGFNGDPVDGRLDPPAVFQ